MGFCFCNVFPYFRTQIFNRFNLLNMNDHTLISSEFSPAYGLRILLYTLFFSLPFTSVSIAQTCGCDVVCLNGLSETMVCGPYNDPAPGPYYVKLYLRFVDAGPGSFEESFAERAETIWQTYRKHFPTKTSILFQALAGVPALNLFRLLAPPYSRIWVT